jgi:hypothetical protein
MASSVTEKDILKSDDSSEEREIIPELLDLPREQEKKAWKFEVESDARQGSTAVSGEGVEKKRTWKSYIWSSTSWSWFYDHRGVSRSTVSVQVSTFPRRKHGCSQSWISP